MNHKVKGRKFGRLSAHRKAMFANLSKALIAHEQISTTLPKAKDLRPIVEKLITLAKDGSLNARRRAISYLGTSPEVDKLFSVIGARCKDRNGGYTRIIKAGFRAGDCAPVAILELVDREPKAKESTAKTSAKAA